MVGAMSTIQIRDVTGETHARLVARAAARGMSLSEYLRSELDRLAGQPTMAEMLDRIATRPAGGGASAGDILREERNRRS